MINTNISKEVCGCCKHAILIGQRFAVCENFPKIIHKKCYKQSHFAIHNSKQMCPNCISSVLKRYNPYKEYSDKQSDTEHDYDHFYNQEFSDEISYISQADTILKNCKNYFSKSLASIASDVKADFSTLFYNIDGNKSNFDKFATELSATSVTFSVIGLAETNVSKTELAPLYNLDDYSGFYSETIEGKSKGTGVGLYVHNSFNAIENEKLCITSQNMESIFLTINKNNKKINVGTVYRSPNGDNNKFIEEFTLLVEQFPKNITSIIVGDFNYDLLKQLESAAENFEEVFLSQGFFPLISLATHSSSVAQSSCIDNIFINDIDRITLSGVIKDIGKHHSPVFSLMNLNLDKASCKSHAQIQEYSYSSKNIDSLTKELDLDLVEIYKTLDFHSFFLLFKNCIDQCCKLATPKCSKRNPINNPWITDAIIDAVEHKNELFLAWHKSKKNEKDPGNKNLYLKFNKYRYCLKKIIKEQKARHYKNKIIENSTNRKKNLGDHKSASRKKEKIHTTTIYGRWNTYP